MLSHVTGRRRALAKAVSYRLTSLAVTATVAFLVVGRAGAALGIGLAAGTLKLGIYYAHERLWERDWQAEGQR